MILKEFNYMEIEYIYNKYMIIDFPKSELKSLKKIIRLTKLNRYFSYGLYENDELVGYALFVTYKNMILLDYFAILSEKRNSNFGSCGINLISDYFKGKYDIFILECENPKFAESEEDKNIRNKRKRFYEKNGFEVINIEVKVYEVEFILLVKNNKINDLREISNTLYNLYGSMSNEEECKKNIFISLVE